MLKVFFGIHEDAMLSVDSFFNNTYNDSWFADPIVIQMVKDIDDSDVLSLNCIQSPILGQIPPTTLSGGVKALICLHMVGDLFLDLIVMGENCSKWLLHIANEQDIMVAMSGSHLTFSDMDDIFPKCLCLNDNSVIETPKEWIFKMIEFL
jgi:hypothetical protein